MPAKKRKLAAIDMGSNSFHLLMAEVSMTGFFPKPRILSQRKQKVRLADGLGDNDSIDDAAISRAIDCLTLFAKELKRFQPFAVKAVATAALRKASNQKELLARFESTLGFPIEVITGEREAEFIYAGVCSASQCRDNVLVIDIGGASTEVVAGNGTQANVLNSLDMGCVVFQNRFFKDGQITPDNVELAIQAATKLITPYAADYKQHGWLRVLGASGTFRALTEIAAAEKQPGLSQSWLSELIQRCIRQGQIERLNFAGLRDDRRAVLMGGITILLAVLKVLSVSDFEVTSGALREGLLAQLANEITA
ncbi:Ppx/GppA family phosphatase [Idiomarina sp. PL1-037]|uniref:Ppx/GppA family phosphatase n=1 Tax=Idiomarina sp. PL1-037 TaxID=3095365 RepID=UPI002ACBF55F|nr:Ppx/GppA family phosphatase [Idiomarina sp. PL1-037]WQC52775.1 Ppx/GppA family phosphatase [Idiomarina sp. PL1-037]